MKELNIAILRGYQRLIDGESTYVEELYNWGLKNNVNFITYYYNAPSKKPIVYDDGYKHAYKSFTIETIEETLEELNQFDAVILMNPARTIRMTEEHVCAFHEMYRKITTKKVFQQHTSFIRAHSITPFLWSYINESDLIYNHSLYSNFMQHAYKLPSKLDRCRMLKTGLDIKKLVKDKEQSSIVRDENKVVYCGRFVGYKGAPLLMDFSEQLVENGYKPEIYGMDSTLGCRVAILEHRNCNNLLFPNRPKMENPIVDVYGRISRQEVLDKYRESMFAWGCVSFRQNDKNRLAFENRLEYSIIEAIANGAIPVLEKGWAETNYTYDGLRFSDIENFAVLYDKENPQNTIDQMNKIRQDKELQEAYRRKGLEIIFNLYDINKILTQMIEEIVSVDKDTEKLKDDVELVRFITKNDDLVNKYIELKNEKKIIPLHHHSIMENQLAIFEGKAIKRITAEDK